MRSLVAALLFAVACAPTTTTVADPRPTPETGGFRAPEPAHVEWVELGTPVSSAPLQQTLEISPNVGPLSQLMLKGVSGEARVAQVLVQYADKQERTVRVNKTFAVGDGQVIELRESRAIARVTLFVDPDSSGSVLVYGG